MTNTKRISEIIKWQMSTAEQAEKACRALGRAANETSKAILVFGESAKNLKMDDDND